MMKVWVSIDFVGFYPVGSAAVVVAATEDDAREELTLAIATAGLPKSNFTLKEIGLTDRAAYVLVDGNY